MKQVTPESGNEGAGGKVNKHSRDHYSQIRFRPEGTAPRKHFRHNVPSVEEYILYLDAFEYSGITSYEPCSISWMQGTSPSMRAK